jgi:uncharacterized membrane protein YoaK (UPF0700 family)
MSLSLPNRQGAPTEEKLSRYDDLGLVLLSGGAGCADVLAFLKLGDLFTSAMTGNTALLAIAVGRGHLLAASRSFCALAGFALGIVLATAITSPGHGQREDRRRNLRRLLPLELIFLVSCTTLWSLTSHSVHGVLRYAIIALSALSMGIQAIAARASNSSGINTIVFTTNFVNILVIATRALAHLQPQWNSLARSTYLAQAFVAYGAGAVLAAFLVNRGYGFAIWIPIAAVLLAFGSFELARGLEERIP